jgi:hypothetical protein
MRSMIGGNVFEEQRKLEETLSAFIARKFQEAEGRPVLSLQAENLRIKTVPGVTCSNLCVYDEILKSKPDSDTTPAQKYRTFREG